MRIAFFEVKPWEQIYLSEKLREHELVFFEEPLNERNLMQVDDCEAISIFIYSKVGKYVLDKMPKLKLVATRSTGFDHIDIEDCKKRKINVSHVPFYGENTVAEHAFGLILSLSRNIHKSYVRTLRDDFSIDGLTGFDLKDKTIGIIGGGNIGMHVARMAKGFQMNVLVYDIKRDEKLAKSIGFKYAELDDLIKDSDVISLHVPYNKFTHHLINEEKISLMKRGVILINTARGGIIDTTALLWALEKRIIGGLGLDVIEGEHLIQEEKQLLHESDNVDKWKEIVRAHRIFRMDNVVFTPHNAFNSKEALTRILDATIENIKLVNKKHGNRIG
ncbi:MAG: NAD(P)-dependent oxidoreductase [Nanoarchaeota archaeon]